MLQEFTDWLLGLVRSAFEALWTFLSDLFISLVKMVLEVVVALLSSLSVPSFLSNGLGALFGDLAPGILWILTASGLPVGLGIIGAGYLFRIGRKIVTLGQW